MGIGTRVQYSEVPLSVGNVISDGLSTMTRVLGLSSADDN
jgi:hypothetical protein